jgi:hypothetical protein
MEFILFIGIIVLAVGMYAWNAYASHSSAKKSDSYQAAEKGGGSTPWWWFAMGSGKGSGLLSGKDDSGFGGENGSGGFDGGCGGGE